MHSMIYRLLLLAGIFPTCLGMMPLDITKKNLRFVDYPGFPGAHSTWGSIGYSTIHKGVFALTSDGRLPVLYGISHPSGLMIFPIDAK